MGASFIGSEISAFGTTASATEVSTAGTFRSSYSRSAVELSTSGETIYAEWDSAVVEGWIHFVMQGILDNDSGDLVLVVTTNAGGNLFRLVTPALGQLLPEYWNGSTWISGSVFGPDTGVAPIVIQLVAGASGAYAIYQHGAAITSDEAAFSGTDMKRATFHCPDNSSPQNFSEIILSDETISLLGSIVETEPPTAAGTDTGGTGAYTDIDEGVVNDADVLAFASAADRHSFTSAARTQTLNHVHGVSVAARMKRDVSGPQSAKFYLKIGGTRYYSPDILLTESYEGYQYTWEENPATTDPWTVSDANSASLEWGIEAVA